jgi:pyruvate formate lyase activating enzyme
MSGRRGLVADVVEASCVDGPGNRCVVFLQGCTFNCLACHNPHTIACRPTGTTRWVDVDELVDDIVRAAPFISGVTVSGGEATVQWGFVHELFQQLADHPETTGLTRLVDTNGDAEPPVWDVLATSMHGAMVDLKALDPDVHRYLTGRENRRVLDSLRQLAGLGLLTEVRLLLVPDVNDSEEQLEATARFLCGLDREVPPDVDLPEVVVLGFRHEGTRPVAAAFRDATSVDVDNAVETLTAHGIDRRRLRPTSHDVSTLT